MTLSRSPAVPAPGFFGKVPPRGDFLARRIPPGAQAAWDAWLASLVVAAQSALGDAWPADWLTAPLWHFMLGRDIAPPTGAAGVLIASMDRVGRFFPFTIIASGTPHPDSNPAHLEAWSSAIEALALSSLEDTFDPEALDSELRTLGAPALRDGVAQAPGHWGLVFEDGWPRQPEDAFAVSALQAPGADQSVWWCRGSERVAPMHLRCAGLPDMETAAAMITGAFDIRP